MSNVKRVEYIITVLMSLLTLLLTIYICFPVIVNILLYTLHVLYLIQLIYLMNKYSLNVSSGSTSIFINIDKRKRIYYSLFRFIKLICYLHAYILLLIFTSMIVLNRNIDQIINTFLLILTMNTLYSTIIFLINTVLRNYYLAAIILVLLNILGLVTKNPYIVPLIMFPKLLLTPVLITLTISILLLVLSAIRWSRVWISKL